MAIYLPAKHSNTLDLLYLPTRLFRSRWRYLWLLGTDAIKVVESRTVRFRTIGDMTCTGAVESTAATVQEIIDELSITRVTERGSRIDDKRSDAAMEDRKKEGYF